MFLVLNLNGTKTLMGFIRQHAGFCRTQKLKLLSLVISGPVRFVCVKNTWSSDVLRRPTWEAWAPELECLGARRAPRKFYSGNQLWGLGALTKMHGSPKGSLKFSLEHSLAYIWRGDLTEGFLHYEYWGPILGGAYKWRGLFSEFYGKCNKQH